MRNRLLWAALVGLAELGVCAAILVATWGGVTWARDEGLRWRVFSSDTVSVDSEEELRFAVDGPAALDLSNRNGSIDVASGETDEIVVTIHRTAWGAGEAEAQARLAELVVNASQRANTVTVAVPDKHIETLTIMGSYRSDSVAFTVIVPAETEVTAGTDFGDVSLAGTTGAADLRTSAGALTVQHVTGRVTAHSDFGEIEVEDVTGDLVEAASSSGAVRLRRVVATDSVSLETDFGDVAFEGGEAGALTAKTSSGAVTLTGLTVLGQVVARSDFGSVRLESVEAGGGYDLHTSSGAVIVDGASGVIAAGTDFGDVTVLNALSATLDLSTSNGSVRFSGALGSGPHELESDFGSLVLSLPADTRADVDLRTDFGRISSAFPVTLGGDLDEDHWRGEINGGGPSLTARTSSGDITLEQLP